MGLPWVSALYGPGGGHVPNCFMLELRMGSWREYGQILRSRNTASGVNGAFFPQRSHGNRHYPVAWVWVWSETDNKGHRLGVNMDPFLSSCCSQILLPTCMTSLTKASRLGLHLN